MRGLASIGRTFVLVAVMTPLLQGCAGPAAFKISNDTESDVTLAGCAQEPGLQTAIPSHGTFSFTDNVGERTLSDDPGFACLLKLADGQLRCLRLPTDQSSKRVFSVREAESTDSYESCVAHSDPHL